MATAAIAESQALTFTVAGETLALSAGDVAEVIRLPALVRVPLAPRGMAGVINLRGSVVPIVSLGLLLGKGEGARSGAARIVIVDQGSPVGLIVDEVSALVPVDRVLSGEAAARFLDLDALLAREMASSDRKLRVGNVVGAAESRPVDSVGHEAFLSFDVAGQEFALPLADVREVLAVPADVAMVSRTDEAMVGVMSLRNRLLPLLSLPVLLGLEARAQAQDARIVVANIGGASVGLVVDGVRAIVRAGPDEIDPVPQVLTRGRQEAQIQAICRLEGGRRLVSILATDHLLEKGLAERLGIDGIEEDRAMEEVASAGTERFVVFQLGAENYGLPIDSVEEVVGIPDRLTRLPKAPDFIEGIMNLRGKVVPVIDQRRRFEAAAASVGRRGRIVVVRLGDAHAGFVVDSVSEVLAVPAEQLRPSPELASSGSKVIDRIANLDSEGRMVLLVDPQQLLDKAEQDLLVAMHGQAPAPS